ncbi:MAG: DUF2079 domain-containing protein [Cyanobacteria bacterium P01_H01_bin.15]
MASKHISLSVLASFWRDAPWKQAIAVFLILLGCSSLRHELLQSASWDLGIFDQAVFLISDGKTPISSLLGFHILGDHGAVILYPLAVLYRLWPSVYWLFAAQALGLTLGGLGVWVVARQAGLKPGLSRNLALSYWLYPLIFNVNLADFHPETIVVSGLFWAVWAARANQLFVFAIAITLILSAKAVWSLTVVGLGGWLLIERRFRAGSLGILIGSSWFLFAITWLIPHFGGVDSDLNRHFHFYSHLGRSYGEILRNLLTQPGLVFSALFTGANFGYLILLILPWIWGLHWRSLTPLIAALPALSLNLLSQGDAKKDLVHQYSLPILPYFMIAVIAALAIQKTWFTKPRWIVLWAVLCFAVFGKWGYFGSLYLEHLNTWSASRAAIAQVPAEVSVLTTNHFAPHLTHRRVVKLIESETVEAPLNKFAVVLIDTQRPGWLSSPELVATLTSKLATSPQFKKTFDQGGVLLFQQLNASE